MNDFCIILTGLPASGKTTLGRELASSLNLPIFDKDDYTEALYDKLGTGDRAYRQKLSTKGSELFQADAIQHQRVILVTHWRPTTLSGPSGTPTAWLEQTYKKVVEIYCECPVDFATERFIQRKRHPGHLDEDRTKAQTFEWLRNYGAHLPIGIGQLIRVKSNAEIQVDSLIEEIHQALSAQANSTPSFNTFTLNRMGGDVVYHFKRGKHPNGQIAYQRQDNKALWIEYKPELGWVAFDEPTNQIMGRPWNLLPKDQNQDHPPEGEWVSKKGAKSYVYLLKYS